MDVISILMSNSKNEKFLKMILTNSRFVIKNQYH